MWNQWTQYAGAPPLPTTAPPPPPQEPSSGNPPGTPIIGPMLPSAVPAAPLPSSVVPTASATVGTAAMPSPLGTNPYSEYTAAQYAAMTPEQQYALQQHWQQWQKYQEEYARWHAQYGEQYKREMELAQKTSASTPSIPTAAATPAYTSPYYQQPLHSAPSSKITGQPQLYTQPPPPQAPAPSAGISNTSNYPTMGSVSAAQQPTFNQQPPNYNQPPPNFNTQNFNSNKSLNTQFQDSNFAGRQQHGGAHLTRPSDSVNFLHNKSNERGNLGLNTAGGANNWQGPPSSGGVDNFNRSNNWNSNDSPIKRNYNSGNDTNTNITLDNVPPSDKNNLIDNENMAKDNNEPNSNPNNWSEGENYQGGLDINDHKRSQTNWNESNAERAFGQNNRGTNARGPNNWNDGPNNRGNNGPQNWSESQSNRGANDRNFGSNRGPNNWNQSSNNRGSNKWNEGQSNRGPNNWNDRGTNNWNESQPNRDSNNWSDDYNNRSNSGRNDWNDNGASIGKSFGANNRGHNSWNDSPCVDATNDRNYGPNNRGNNRLGDVSNHGRSDVSNQRGGYGSAAYSGSENRGRITDLDEEMFDRQFRQWEQQFEDWKKANANHPDKEMYNRYEQEFEKQRKRIAERREQMRRRKLEQMGMDPKKPPPQPSPIPPRAGSIAKENIGNTDTIVRKRNDSVGSHQSSHSKQNQEEVQEVKPICAQETNQELSKPNVNDNQTGSINLNLEDDIKKQNEESIKTATINENVEQKKITALPQGKRKSRFDTPAPAIKIKPIESIEIINLDDVNTDMEEVEDKGNMSEIFKKVDGIPGLDLTDDNSSGPIEVPTKDEEPLIADNKVNPTNLSKNQAMTTVATKKIPSLFDIKVDKPDMSDVIIKQTQSAATPAALPDLAKTLNDPDFLKRISEAVANVKGSDITKTKDGDGRQLSFSEWQQHKPVDGTENKSNDDTVDLDNTNSRESFRDKSSNRSDIGDDLNSNFIARSGGGGGSNSGGGTSNNFGPNNFGNNGPNNWGFNGNNWGPNSSGPNNWGPNGPNNWGPNGPNTWGPNGPNNNFGPNGPNHNFGSNASNNNFGRNGPNNNFGRNGPNNNFGHHGSNNNFGPNGPNNWGPNGPNIWGNNGPNNSFGQNSCGSNNWGPNVSGDSGPHNNFRGENNFGAGRNFGGNGLNDRSGRNFGCNDGQGRNFSRNANNFGQNDGSGQNFGRNGPGFGASEGTGRNYGGDGPNNSNMVGDFGENEIYADNFNRGDSDGNRPNRNRGDRRDGAKNRKNSSNNKRDNSNNRNNTCKDSNNSDDNGTPNRNINNPFRRSDVPKVEDSKDDDFISKDQNVSWTKGPDDRDNIDYGDYYRPVQVIDYSNCNAKSTTTITPTVIDYGHKPVMNDDSNAFKPLKIINYDHASKAKNPKQQARLNSAQKRRKRKNKNNSQPQKQQNQNQKYKQQQQKQKQMQKQLLQNPTTTADSEKDSQKQSCVADAEKEQDELEAISDVEDMPEEPQSPPPPPPPMFNTSGTFTPFNAQETPLSIFPSTSEANENLKRMSATHVQMSIPTEENNNTISIDEILMKPGRQTRPKKICMILRGPPGSGKSHVAKLIKEKEKEMGGNNPRILSIDDYFLIENDYEEKCPKTGKKIPKKEILYEYDKDMEEKYMEYLIKSFKKSVADNFYDFIVIDCNNNSLRSLNEFYCHSKDSGFVPYIIDLFCDLETCLERNIHERSEKDIKDIIDTWKSTPGHYIKLDISSLLQNIVEMEDAEDMVVDDNTDNDNAVDSNMTYAYDQNQTDDNENEDEDNDNYNDANVDDDDDDDSNDSVTKCGFLKSKWETDTTTENLARLDGTSKLSTKRKPTMEEYLQMDEWQPPTVTKGKKRVRWADIEEKRKQEKMRAVGFVVGQTDWKRMMDPNAAKRALNKTKYIERVNKRR